MVVPQEPQCQEERRQRFDPSGKFNYKPANKIHVEPLLWLGNVCAANDLSFLQTHTISCIINMASEWEKNQFGVNHTAYGIAHYKIGDLKDHNDVNFLSVIQEASVKLYECVNKQNRGTLVFCNAGISRSASVVIHYLMNKSIMQQKQQEENNIKSFKNVLSYLRTERPIVRPNAFYMANLKGEDPPMIIEL